MEVSGQLQFLAVFLPGKDDDNDNTNNNIRKSNINNDKCITVFDNPGSWLQVILLKI
jgi:hypothetical protein